jgi:hypothetical protein
LTDSAKIDLGGVLDPAEVAGLIKAAVGRAFADESTTRQRDPHNLGISAISGCTRFAAYAIAGTPASDQPDAGEGRAANLGTWQHNGLLPRVADQFDRGTTEVDVVLRAAGLDVPGHIDLDVPGMVLDLKTVGEWRLQAVRQSGAFHDHVMQVAAYAVAKLQAGQPPRWLVILYLDRASGDEQAFVIPFTNEHVMMVVDRVAEIRRWADDDPDTAPRRDASGAAMSGPGWAFKCNECPWLRRCWGPDAQPGVRYRHDHDNAEVEALLLEYIEANAVEGPAKRRKAEIAKLLETTKHGTYGAAKYRRAPDTIVDDPDAALKVFKTLGYDVPQRPKRGNLSIRLTTTTPARKRKPRKKKTES